MMNDREKSDPLVVAMKPANNDGQPSTEPVERRGGAEGNAHQPSTLRTPSRDGVTAGLARIRTAANALPSITQGGSRMREFRTYGSVRGARSNARPYRDPHFFRSRMGVKELCRLEESLGVGLASLHVAPCDEHVEVVKNTCFLELRFRLPSCRRGRDGNRNPDVPEDSQQTSDTGTKWGFNFA
jgi:hypothetical protein